MDKLLFKRILVSALTVLALIYVGYLLISANFDMYPTENAVKTTVTNKIFTNAFIIRDETVIENNSDGVLSYSCYEGEEVKAGGEIAKIYQSEDDALNNSIADSLEKQKIALENLQKNGSAKAVGIDTINNSIHNHLITYLSNVNNGDLTAANSSSYNLLDSINQRQIYTGKSSNFNEEIADLNAQISQLRNSSAKSTGSIKTEKAGYFSEFCDGYENAIKYTDLDKIKLEDLDKIEKSEVGSNNAGKIISNLNWYVACKVSSDEATELSLWDGNVTVLFSNAATEKIPASVYRIYQESKDSDALVILQCDYMDDGLIEARQEPIEIGLGTYTGLRISKRAIHDDFVTKTTYDENDKKHTEEKKVQGVYVLYGSEVQFKQISLLYADEDYVICDPNPDKDKLFNGETVSLYDKVITKGDDLYDGKVIK